MKDLIKNLKFAWRYCKDQKVRLIKYILFNILSIIINVVIPLISAKAIIYLTENSFYQLVLVAVMIFIVENTRNLVHYFTDKYSSLIYRETYSKIEVDLGREMLKLENSVIDANSSGLFIQRLTNDTSKIADIFNELNQHLTGIISNIGIYVAIFIINKFVFLYFLVTTIFIFYLTKLRVDIYNEKDKDYRKKHERVAGFIGEMVRGTRDIKMLNSEDSFINDLSIKIKDLNSERYDMLESNRKYRLLIGFTRDLVDLLSIILLVFLIQDGQLTIASALIVHNYSSQVDSIRYYIGTLLERIKDFKLSSSRIFAILESEEFKKEEFGKVHLDKVNGDFEFKNVSFAYDEKEVLKDINFKVNANETVAFVGKSGVGKTTIFNLLCKMYDVKDGTITIDGHNIKDLDKDSIRGNITIISQNPYIFNLSIRDNFRLVKEDLTEEEMIDACKLACLDEFINTLPEKYDTIIGEGGVNLSGGQKQRIAIARALIQKTEIILFDEATSALDNETQASIQKAIENMKNEYTIMIIAHRLSTIINCDRIIFVDDGKVEMIGTHEELLQTCEKYRSLYESEIK